MQFFWSDCVMAFVIFKFIIVSIYQSELGIFHRGIKSFFFSSSLEQFGLTKPTDFWYLNQSGCVNDPSLDDKGDFVKIRVSLIFCFYQTKKKKQKKNKHSAFLKNRDINCAYIL